MDARKPTNLPRAWGDMDAKPPPVPSASVARESLQALITRQRHVKCPMVEAGNFEFAGLAKKVRRLKCLGCRREWPPSSGLRAGTRRIFSAWLEGARVTLVLEAVDIKMPTAHLPHPVLSLFTFFSVAPT